MIITINPTNADDYTLAIADLYWDPSDQDDSYSVDQQTLQQYASFNPSTQMWCKPTN